MVNWHFHDRMVRCQVLQYVLPRGEGGQPDRAVIDAAVCERALRLRVMEKPCEDDQFIAGPAQSFDDRFAAPLTACVEPLSRASGG